MCFVKAITTLINVVTDMKARAGVIKKDRLWYRCLQPYHGIKNCRSRMKCFKCQSVRHHTAICEGEHGKQYEDKAKGEGKFDNPPIQTVAHLTAEKNSVMLQTINVTVGDVNERKILKYNMIFDGGSQRIYVSQRVVD